LSLKPGFQMPGGVAVCYSFHAAISVGCAANFTFVTLVSAFV
jgi:hypothetical protein